MTSLYGATSGGAISLKKPIVIAHRGGTERAPENTILAFETSCEMGAQMFELDVHETSDQHLVCIHDYTVDRTTNGQGLVSEMTLDEIRRLDAGMGQKVPLLSEALDIASGRSGVNIELKVLDIEERAVDLVVEKEMSDSVLVSSFFHESLRVIRKSAKSLPTGVLYNQPLEEPIQYALQLGATAINPHHELVSKELVSEAGSDNLRVYSWTVNTEDKVLELAGMGVDGIITDRPEMCLRLLKEAFN
ncbi:glycerophosphodiester phosphodiesterase [Candidatus Thorarchaeota archaeon]|nr:MAG: glycerophosphodiester phosphodiesterase [Candidatus Thorarchaeota archaeon]